MLHGKASRWQTTPIYGLMILATLAILWIAFDKTGFLDGKHLTAVLAFFGVLVTASVTFAGLVVKEQSDRRTIDTQVRDTKRLEVEAAMKAASLLSTDDGSDANPSTVSGALLALAQLGQVELAMTMLSDLWLGDRVSPATGILIVDRALTSEDSVAQQTAAIALRNNVSRLTTANSYGRDYFWPHSVNQRWLPNLAVGTKRHILVGWSRMWITDQKYYAGLRPQIFASGLLAVWQKERDPGLRTFVSQQVRIVIGHCKTSFPTTRHVNDSLTTIGAALLPELEASEDQSELTDELRGMLEWVESWASNGARPLEVVMGDMPTVRPATLPS
jgi:hypothetical protein